MELSHRSGSKFFIDGGQTCLHRGSQVLAVDDDEDNLLLVTYALEPLNCSIITAGDSQTALEKAQQHQPDLILLDILLFRSNGLDFLHQLRKDPKTMNIPVVAVTAMARPEDKERILLAGCNDYISKPYMLEDMEAIVCRYLKETAMSC